MAGPLDIFLSELPAASRRRWAAHPSLQAELDALFADARLAQPTIDMDAATFARFVGSRMKQKKELSLPREHAGALLVALGCGLGDEGALAIFQKELVPVLRRAAARIDSRPDFVDEVAQRAQIRLLVGEHGEPPRLMSYDGRTNLEAWVAAAATWLAIDLQRAGAGAKATGSNDSDDLALQNVAASLTGMESLYLRRAHQEDLSAAFKAALESLDARQRNVLRLHFVDGLNIDRIGELYDVHRATVARWISRSREQLFEQIRAALGERLGGSSSEVDSLIRGLRSELNLNLSRLFAGP